MEEVEFESQVITDKGSNFDLMTTKLCDLISKIKNALITICIITNKSSNVQAQCLKPITQQEFLSDAQSNGNLVQVIALALGAESLFFITSLT